MEKVILKIAFGATQLNEFTSYRCGVIVPLNKKVICKEFNLKHWPITHVWKNIFQNIFRLKLLQRFQESQSTLDKDFLVSYEIGIDETKFTILTNFCPYGNLFEWFQQRASFHVEDVCHIVHHLCLALDYLHGRNIFHGNIKPFNIFFKTDSSTSVSLALDFSVLTEINLLTNNINQMFIYLSPEYLDLVVDSAADFHLNSLENICQTVNDLWNKKSSQMDSWSVGIIMHLLITGRLPFLEYKEMSTLLNDMKRNSCNTFMQHQMESGNTLETMKNNFSRRAFIGSVGCLEIPISSEWKSHLA
ncbi:unnamed protein product [Heterobilharzia americana]|nr:unnamed protein product [Heterobilharzia americana]